MSEQKNSLSMTQKELLIRIDERQKSMDKRLLNIETALINPSEHSQLMESMVSHESRLDALETFKTQIVAYIGVAGAIGGLVVSLVTTFIKERIF